MRQVPITTEYCNSREEHWSHFWRRYNAGGRTWRTFICDGYFDHEEEL